MFILSRKNSDYNYDLELEIPILDKKFDLVIHCAGKAHSIPNNKFEETSFFKANIDGLVNLLKSLSDSHYLKHFVFISSVSVYGLIEGLSIDEMQPLLSTEPYGKSKIEGEKIIIQWCNENKVICTILRLPLVVGENPPGNLGSMIRGIKKGYYFNISGGHAQKSMVLASDIASAILNAANVGGIFNLTDGIHPSFNELSTLISLKFGKSKVLNLSYKFARIIALLGDIIGNSFPLDSKKLLKMNSTLIFDDSKARKAFGWNPTPVLKAFKLNSNEQ